MAARSWKRSLPLDIMGPETAFINGVSLDGIRRELAVDRTPALYSGDFGDCLGGQSLLNVTKLDAAFYFDNSTISWHLNGNTNLQSEELMMYITVDAYGKNRFSMTIDPCKINIYSMCPMNATVPITAWAVFPVGQQQVSGIPQIAYEMPDFEGSVRVQLFANSSQLEIACFQAVMRNGASFAQPAAVSSVLGIFTAVAILASFAAAAYGVSIPHMRTHYAHSFSVLILFETFQTVFFSGALSLQWPSVLPAWWSNFAWSAGLIPVPNMVDSFNRFAGISGNGSQVGGAGSTIINNNGGLIQQIYGRSLESAAGLGTELAPLLKRQPYNPDDPYDYNWSGDPVTPGMPTPGDWSGFGGTLSGLNIPAPDAFMLAFIWLIIALCIVTGLIAIFKFSLEGLAKLKWIQHDRLEFFRNHWTRYLRAALLRTLSVAFFSMMVLSLSQFNLRDRAGPLAIAAIVFLLFLIGVGGIAVYALRCRLRSATFSSDPDRILFVSTKILWCIPWFSLVRISQLREKEFSQKPAGSLPFVHWHFVQNHEGDSSSPSSPFSAPRPPKVHEDETYLKRFGWLSARYRASRWWYFLFWLSHQFVRALFIGAAASSPLAQVFGLFVVDIFGMVVVAALNPYEGQRNTVLAVWLLGLARIATTGLSIAFLPDFALNRMVAAVIGVIIIVLQALLVIAVLILVVLGAISSWMSVYRNREYFPSERLQGTRIRYYEHIARKALDKDAPPVEEKKKQKSKKQKTDSKKSPSEAEDDQEKATPNIPKAPSFSVRSVRRLAKIEDEDEDNIAEMMEPPSTSSTTNANNNISNTATPRPPLLRHASRTGSLSSRHSTSSLPRAARVHRASWSSRDFSAMHNAADLERPDTARANRHSRSLSASTLPNTLNMNSTMGGSTAALRGQGSLSSLGAGGSSGGGGGFVPPVMPVKEDAGEDQDVHVGGYLDEHVFRKNLDNWNAGEEDRASQKTEEESLDDKMEKTAG
ncbi:TRP-like ion channel [Apiospora phragmitis]|uniref:TRP-like ion channel n=1 Tax=Apiospora phragmitis TaxID=2905665 RepID=A0ABR1VSK7_9PEZI